MKGYSEFFSQEEHQAILDAIKIAERKTSGEIRVHLEDRCDLFPEDRAAYVFDKLEMFSTADRNGVLFYLAVQDKRFAVIGDLGIHERVGTAFWKTLRDELQADFKQGNFKDGLIGSIHKMGERLSHFFPYERDDVNELSDEISKGDL